MQNKALLNDQNINNGIDVINPLKNFKFGNLQQGNNSHNKNLDFFENGVKVKSSGSASRSRNISQENNPEIVHRFNHF